MNHEEQSLSEMIATLYERLEMLRRIEGATILTPGFPQDRYHQIIEDAYVLLGRVETEVDTLKEELGYQHQRLDEARDNALAEATEQEMTQEKGK